MSFKPLEKTSVQLRKYIARKHWTVFGTELEDIKETVSSGSGRYNMLDIAFYRGMTEDGVVQGSADLDLQSNITIPSSRQLPDTVLVYTIPRDRFGLRIEPGSVKFIGSFGNITDKEGILLKGNSNVGDIIYSKGIIVITDSNTISQLDGSETLEYTSNLPVYTYIADCCVKSSEMNFSLNPTLTEETGKNKDFTPYVTTVGLYNKAYELVAIAKLSKPIKKASNVDMTFKIQLDV